MIQSDETFRYGSPRALFPETYNIGNGRRYDISPDGQRFLMIKEGAASEDPQQVILVQNWMDELKRLVPAGN